MIPRQVVSANSEEAGGCGFVPNHATPTARAGSITSSGVDQQLRNGCTTHVPTSLRLSSNLTTALSIVCRSNKQSIALFDRFKSILAK